MPISKAILGQTLTTEIGSTGSYAASNTHMQVRQDIVDSDKKLVEDVINQLIQWFYEINFANGEVPVFELYEPEDVDLTLAQRDKILSDTGVKFTKEYFIKNYGLEDEDFDINIKNNVINLNFILRLHLLFLLKLLIKLNNFINCIKILSSYIDLCALMFLRTTEMIIQRISHFV